MPQPHPLQSSPLLWKPSHDHASWLKELLCALITSGGVSDEVLSLVKPVCRVKPSFCEKVFPLVVHDILSANAGDHLIKQSLSKQARKISMLDLILMLNFFANPKSWGPCIASSVARECSCTLWCVVGSSGCTRVASSAAKV